MARTREFDTEVVLAASAALFVRTGYEATSIDELVSATGLHRGSLYAAFGSKRGIFVAALRRQASAPLDTTDRLDLLLVALLELAPRDSEVQRLCELEIDALPGDPAHVLGTRILDRARLTLYRKETTS